MEQEQMRSYYAIIPANVRYDKDLTPNAKLLYGEITALCNDKGFCWATNEYFAELYNVSKISVSNWVSALVKKGYISSEIIYKEGTKEILNRYLSLVKYPIKENFNRGIKENFKDNNTYINNTINNIKEESNKEEKETLYDFLQQNGFVLSPFDYEVVSKWEDNSLTRHAIQEAVYKGKIYVKYVDGIIRNFKNEYNSPQYKDNLTVFKQNKAVLETQPSWLNEEIEADEATPEEIAEFERQLANL